MDNKDKIIQEMARIIAFDLCPQAQTHKTLYGDKAQCYSDTNFAECNKIKMLVDKLYHAGYRKLPENAVVIPEKITEQTSPSDLIKIAKYNESVRKETAKEILEDLYSEATSNISETVELTTFQIEQLAKQYGVEIKE